MSFKDDEERRAYFREYNKGWYQRHKERLLEKPPIPYGYIFYFGSRKRIQIHFTPTLRAKTLAAIKLAFQVATLDTPPPPLEGKIAARCRDCSLLSLCLPDEVRLLTDKKGGSLAYTLPD